ncbi:MAG TPA: tetratricopeptide repeat protein [Methanocorpusculum sp.]|nr:tetratricopeptide repeat protein [Methanocorpusculum sp.]
MRFSEGNLTQQYYCDYLTILIKKISSSTTTDDVLRSVHESIVFHNLFFHRMNVDGGFHTRVLSTLLQQPDARRVLLDLLAKMGKSDVTSVPVEEWLKREYASAVEARDNARMIAVEALLRSYISGTNQVAEIIVSTGDFRPLSWWKLETRRITFLEIANSDMYFDIGCRPFWHEFPFDRYAAVMANVPDLPSQRISDCVSCIAGAWFSSLTREEMISWLNISQPTSSEWKSLCAPLLKCDYPDPALSSANWLYASGNNDPAMDLYAKITLAFPETFAEFFSFEMMGDIFRNSGDFDNAFEAYKNAFLMIRGANEYQTAISLKNLCEIGDELGEDMSDYYARIASIARLLPLSERTHLYMELASSCRRRRSYEEEYMYLEQVLDAEERDEDLIASAFSRLLEMNSFLTVDGKLDHTSLVAKDVEYESTIAMTRGIIAYFGFDPICALRWYERSGLPVASSLRFTAAMAADVDAEAYVETSIQRAILLTTRGAPIEDVIREMNVAITEIWQNDCSLSKLFSQIIPYLPLDRRSAILSAVTTRATLNDERAIVCSAVSQALLSFGLVDEARSMLRMALRANPGRDVRSHLFMDLGWLEYEVGAYTEATSACDAALKINDQFPAAWACRARALACMGRYDEAFVASEYAVVQNPSNTSYQHLRAALEVVLTLPVDPLIDLMFVLPDPGYLQAAAARYCARNGGFCKPSVWDVMNVEDVVSMRFIS